MLAKVVAVMIAGCPQLTPRKISSVTGKAKSHSQKSQTVEWCLPPRQSRQVLPQQ